LQKTSKLFKISFHLRIEKSNCENLKAVNKAATLLYKIYNQFPLMNERLTVILGTGSIEYYFHYPIAE